MKPLFFFSFLTYVFFAGIISLHASDEVLAVVSDKKPVVNGDVIGDLQINEGGQMAFNSSASIEGRLLLPGTPRLRFNGRVEEPLVVEGAGSATPEGYWVFLNRGASIQTITTRSNPHVLPQVSATTPISGWRWVSLYWSGAELGDFATVHSLFVGSLSTPVSVPPGSYGMLVANRGATVVLGSPEASEPLLYEFDRIILNGGNLEIAGPVILRLNSQLVLNSGSHLGEASDPSRLAVEVYRGDVVLNGRSSLYGSVVAPSGRVILNSGSEIVGTVRADRFIVNSNGIVRYATTRLDGEPSTPENSPPVAVPAEYNLFQGQMVDFSLEGSDPDGDEFSFRVESSVTFGQLTTVAGQPVQAGVLYGAEAFPFNYAPGTDFAGEETLTFHAFDGVIESEPAEIRFLVEIPEPPQVSFDSAPTGYITERSPEIVASVVDGDLPFDSATFFLEGAPVTAEAVAPGHYRALWPAPLADGVYDLVFEATDTLGNSASTGIELRIDATAPALSILAPFANEITEETQPEVRFSAMDASSGLAPASLSVFFGDSLGTVTSEAGVYTARPLTPLTPGEYRLRVEAADYAGNATSISRDLFIDAPLAPPVVEGLSATAGGALYTPDGTPVVGARVQIRGQSGGIRTGQGGSFEIDASGFDELEPRFTVFEFSAPGFITSYRRVLLRAETINTVPPVHLKRRDPAVSLVGSGGGTAVSSQGRIEVDFPVGVLASETPVQATYYEGGHELQGLLPQSSDFTYAVELYPEGLTFSSPVAVRVENELGFDPGTIIPVGYFNPETVRWEHETIAQVSADGLWLEFDVTHFSSYDINVGPSEPAEPPSTDEIESPEQAPKDEEKDPWVSVTKGTGHYNFALPAHTSLGQSRALAFAYDSGHASAADMFSFSTQSRINRNMVRRLRLDFAGRSDEVLTAGESIAREETHNALRFTREDVPTGLYPYRTVVTNEYFGTYGQTVRFGGRSFAFTDVPTRERISRPALSRGWLPFRNERESVFGAGWTLAPLASLAVTPDGSQAVVFEGDGGHTRFDSGATPQAFDPWNHSLGGFDDWLSAFHPAADGSWYFASEGSLYRGGFGQVPVRLTEPLTFLEDYGYFINESNLEIDAIVEAPTGEVYFSVSPNYSGYEDDTQIIYAIYRLGPTDEEPVLFYQGETQIDELSYNTLTGEVLFLEGGVFKALAEADVLRQNEYDAAGLRSLTFDSGRGRTYLSTSEAILFADSADPAAATFQVFFDADTEGFQLLSGGLAVLPDGRVSVLAVRPGYGVYLLTFGRSGQLLLEQPLSGSSWRFDYLVSGPSGDLYFNDPSSDSRLQRVVEIQSDSFVSPTTQPEFLNKDGVEWLWSDIHGNQRRFDTEGRLLVESDRSGNTTAYAYDPEGRLVSLTDPAGLVTVLAYVDDRIATVTDPAGRVTTFSHNSAGQLSRVDFPDGSAQTFEYDTHNRLLAFTDRGGARTAFELTAEGVYREIHFPDAGVIQLEAARDRAIGDTPIAPGLPVFDIAAGDLAPSISTASADTIVNQNGNNFAYLGDSRGQFLKILDAEGHETDFRRDAFGRTTGLTDPVDQVHGFAYDPLGNLASRVRPDGREMHITYSEDFNLPVEIIGYDGETIEIDYDVVGNPIRIRNALGEETTSTYNGHGQPLTVTNPLGETSTMAYNASGNLATLTDPLGHSTTFAYDAAGNLTARTDATGRTTRYTYDAAGRMLTTTSPAGGIWRRSYTLRGQVATETDPLGRTTTYTYDSKGRQTASTDPAGGVTTMVYDLADNLVLLTTPAGERTTMTYDGNNRMITLQQDDDPATVFEYDGLGRVVRTTDAEGRTSSQIFDALGRVIEATRPDQTRFTYEYDIDGNLLSVVDPRGGVRSWTYDAIDRKLSETDPNGGTTRFDYDAAGRLTEQTNRRDQSIELEYDAAGRLIRQDLDDGTEVNRFSYDAAGRTLRAWNAHSDLRYSYDSAGRLQQSIQPAGNIDYTYNLADEPVSRIDPAGRLDYSYDSAGRLNALDSALFGRFTLQHDAASRMESMSYPNGITLQMSRDAQGRIVGLDHRRSGQLLEGQSRTLDAVGNPQTRSRPGFASESFGFDTLDRLLQVAAGGSVAEAYSYDPMGNWQTGGRQHDLDNRITSDSVGSFGYDADGNLTAEPTLSGPRSYNYDALGRLKTVQSPSGTVSYRYDAKGRRYALTRASGVQLTLFDGAQEIGSLEASGSYRSYLSLGEFRLATETQTGLAYVHAGLDGSVLALSDTSGQLIERYRYTAFGQLTVTDAAGVDLVEQPDVPQSPWLFHGRLYEPETGLYWMRARHYSPDLGRFLQPDPIGIAGGANLYAYANNNPLRWFDPWGLGPTDATGEKVGNDEDTFENEALVVDYIQEFARNNPDTPIPITLDQIKAIMKMDISLVESHGFDKMSYLEFNKAIMGAQGDGTFRSLFADLTFVKPDSNMTPVSGRDINYYIQGFAAAAYGGPLAVEAMYLRIEAHNTSEFFLGDDRTGENRFDSRQLDQIEAGKTWGTQGYYFYLENK